MLEDFFNLLIKTDHNILFDCGQESDYLYLLSLLLD